MGIDRQQGDHDSDACYRPEYGKKESPKDFLIKFFHYDCFLTPANQSEKQKTSYHESTPVRQDLPTGQAKK
jgi:hypothetical protein